MPAFPLPRPLRLPGHSLLESMRALGSSGGDVSSAAPPVAHPGDPSEGSQARATPPAAEGGGGWGGPTLVQSRAWRAMVLGRDCVVVAPTGSGKTLAYLMPGLLRCSADRSQPLLGGAAAAPSLLVVAPTRELAMQIHKIAAWLGGRTRPAIKCVCVVGGVARGVQRRQLSDLAVACVVGTPGRLLDFALLSAHCGLVLVEVKVFVADEADRLLDLGFRQPLLDLLAESSHKKRQVALVTATWGSHEQDFAKSLSADAVVIRITGSLGLGGQGEGQQLGAGGGSLEEGGGAAAAREGTRAATAQVSDFARQLPRASESVTQVVELVEKKKRDVRLLDLLEEYHGAQRCKSKIIIFCLYRKEAEHVFKLLKNTVYRSALIKGDMRQRDREMALRLFSRGTRPLLVATDVAGRGLDIADVRYVVNYGMPLSLEAYVHRIGRCGRAGALRVTRGGWR